MLLVAKPACRNASAGKQRVLTVTLSGTIGDKLYNLSFAIEHYTGPGVYSEAAPTVIVLFGLPGASIASGWSNNATPGAGHITVDQGEQTGAITYTLSSAGANVTTQAQVSGNWTCGN
jgi:hypothetical protein